MPIPAGRTVAEARRAATRDGPTRAPAEAAVAERAMQRSTVMLRSIVPSMVPVAATAAPISRRTEGRRSTSPSSRTWARLTIAPSITSIAVSTGPTTAGEGWTSRRTGGSTSSAAPPTPRAATWYRSTLRARSRDASAGDADASAGDADASAGDADATRRMRRLDASDAALCDDGKVATYDFYHPTYGCGHKIDSNPSDNDALDHVRRGFSRGCCDRAWLGVSSPARAT